MYITNLLTAFRGWQPDLSPVAPPRGLKLGLLRFGAEFTVTRAAENKSCFTGKVSNGSAVLKCLYNNRT